MHRVDKHHTIYSAIEHKGRLSNLFFLLQSQDVLLCGRKCIHDDIVGQALWLQGLQAVRLANTSRLL